MILFDSNIWIAYLNKNDSQHKKAEKIFDSLDEKVILPEYLIAEICSVLSLRVNKRAANNFLDLGLNNNDTEVLLSDSEFFVGTLGVFKKIKTNKLSFVDCSLLYLSDFYEVVTFDKALAKVISKKK